MPVKVHALDHLVINVADVARSAEWYRKILGMEIRVFDPGEGKPTRTSLISSFCAGCGTGRATIPSRPPAWRWLFFS